MLFCLTLVPPCPAAWLVRANDSRTSDLLQTSAVRPLHRFKNLPWILCEGGNDSVSRSRLGQMRQARLAQPDSLLRLARTPNDALYPQQQALHPANSEADIHLVQAWARRQSAPDVVVAVIDTGIDPYHEDLEANLWQNPAEANGFTGIDDDHNGYIDDISGWNTLHNNNLIEDNGTSHGTAVCGVLGAVGDNELGVAGVCWSVQLMPVRAFSSDVTSMSRVLMAIDYVLNFPQVKIINASWGTYEFSPALQEAVALAYQRGVLVVAAAGYEQVNMSSLPFYPACLPQVVSVAAVDQAGNLAPFSGYGANITLAAPGVSILTTFPFGQYRIDQGTSFAAPMVTGAAALLLAQEPTLRPATLAERLLTTSRKTAGLSSVALKGGLLDVEALLLSSPPNAARHWAAYP